MESPIVVSRVAARAYHRRAVLLDTPAPNVAAALAHHGYVQIDPINICGRMHDLMLRNRVAAYKEGDLHRHLYGGPARGGFEHYLPSSGILVALPLAAWPFLVGAESRLRRGIYERKLSPKNERLAQRILKEIAERGPLTTDDIEHEGRMTNAWGVSGRLVKFVFETLFVRRLILITARRNFRRVYDLSERVIPRELLDQPPASAAAAARWLVQIKLRQRRLAALKRDELPLVEDLVQPLAVKDGPTLYCLKVERVALNALSDVASTPSALRATRSTLLSDVSTGPSALGATRSTLLLAPLDPLVYDRRVTRALWDFDYTWEVYTPAHKRVRGYYALPVLVGTEIVGHIDPKADRKAGKLRVVKRSVRRGYRASDAVRALANFLGLRP